MQKNQRTVKPKRMIVPAAALLAAALLATGCGQKAAQSKSGAETMSAADSEVKMTVRPSYAYQSDEADSNGLRHFKDAAGREVNVKKELTKVAVLSTDAQSYLYMIAPERLVSVWHNPRDEEYVDSAYVNLPAIGNGKASEQKATLLSYQPEVIIYMSDGNEKETGTGVMAEKLQNDFGVPVVEIDSSFAGQANAFRMLGDLLGKRERGEEIANYMDSVYQRVAAVAAQDKKKVKRVVCFHGAAGNEVLPRSAKVSEVIDLLADNVAVIEGTEAQQRGGSMILEAADVKKLNPDAILTDTDSLLRQMDSDSRWQEIPAVKAALVYRIPARPRTWLLTPAQYPLGAVWLANTLYPEQAKLDLETEVRQYFKVCYGKDLSAEEYEKLFRPKRNEH